MKKLLLLFGLFISTLLFSQSKYTEAQVENSNDIQVIANFVKYNPDNPKTPEFKRKLYALMSGSVSTAAKPKTLPLTKNKLEKGVKFEGKVKLERKDVKPERKDVRLERKDVKTDTQDSSNEQDKKTAKLLTHLFSNDPNDKTAYIQIENKSSCNLTMNISGKKNYTLTVPARNSNFVLIDKGTYTLTSTVCNAKYSSIKNVLKDLAITLNSK